MIKKLPILFLLLFSSVTIFAADFFWVGGSGSWHDAQHWAVKSGGAGGAGIPADADKAIFDAASFKKANEEISITSSISVNAIDLSKIKFKPLFIVSENVNVNFSGKEGPNDPGIIAFSQMAMYKDKLDEFKKNGYSWQPKVDSTSLKNTAVPIDVLTTCTIVVTVYNLCPSQCIGQAIVNHTPSTGNFTYLWSNGQTTQTATGLCAGQGYSVLVNNLDSADQCVQSVAFVNYPPFLSFFTSTQPLCNAACNGTATFNATGGTPPYTYFWTPTGQTTQTATGLCAGGYTVVATDANGCTFQNTFTLVQPLAISPNPTQVNVLCFNQCTGTATVTPSGGTAPYTYSWSTLPSQTTATATGLCAGSYTVTITDNNGCTRTNAITITQPTQLNITATTTGNPLPCSNSCSATATANPSGGTAPYTYFWSPGGQTTQLATGLCAGTYTVVVTDANGCTRQQTVNITAPPALTLNIASTNNPLACFGNCNATLTATVGGGTPAYTYLWTPGNQTTVTITGQCAGSYTVTVTDANGCTIQQNITVTQPTQVQVNGSSVNLNCNNVCSGSATANPSGGTPPYTYSWTPGNATTSSIAGLCAGTYTVTVTDANGCTQQQVFNITQPPPIVPNQTSTNIPCFGLCVGTATVNPTGGNSPYTYLWSPGGQTTNSVTGLCAGNYTVVITDATGCTRQQVFNITEPQPLVLTPSQQPLQCNNTCIGVAAVSVAGGTAGYSYLWTPGNFTTSTITGLCAGTYTCVVTDANGCTQTTTVTIVQPTQVSVATASNNVQCNGQCNGSASALGGGGSPPYTYQWMPGGQTTTSITGLCAGTYTVTVTDANGCSVTNTITITQPQPILPNLNTTNVQCNGGCTGASAANPSGGTAPYTYLWMPGNITTQSVTGLCVGSYTLTIADANGCTAQQIINITQPSGLSSSITSSTTSCNVCNGSATANATGGTLPYTFSWAPGGQTTQTATGLCPGTYTVFVTDLNGCTSQSVVNILQTVQINVTTSNNTPSCFGSCDGIATANPTGGQLPYSYLWNPSNQTTQTATGLCAGTYTVTVTDANGCFNTSIVIFTNPPQLTANAAITNVTCNNLCNGAISVIPGGGTPGYTFAWLPGGQTTATVTGLCAGSYTVTVTDANGCTNQQVLNVSQAPPIIVTPTNTLPACNQCNGQIVLNPSGGSGIYTSFVWTPNVSSSGTAINLCAGVYTIVITDNTGCSQTVTVNLSNQNGPSAVTASTNATCNGGCNGTASVGSIVGTGPFTFDWLPGTPTGDGTQNISNLCAGTYTVQVTDQGTGCISLFSVTVTEPAVIAGNAIITNASCNGNCNGIINLSPSGGTPGYTYLWTPGNMTTQNVTGLCAGNYTVVITDAAACTQQLTFTITEPAVLNVPVSSTDVLCNSACNGTATASPTGGTSPYIYLWSNNQSLQTIVNLCPGTYTVVVTDANGCTSQNTVTIAQPNAITSSEVHVDATCNSGCDGTATVTPSGGTAPFTFLWSPGGMITASVTGLCAGNYNVTITDANGCTLVQNVSIAQPTAIAPNATATNASCNGGCNGTVTASPTGGTPNYTFLWNPGGFTTQSVTGLCAGNYTVTITDANGCTQNQVVTVMQPLILQANTSSTSPLCNGNCNGSVLANPIGGTGPFTYLWLPGNQTTPSVGGLCAGSYTVIVTDANGCTDQQTINVVDPPLLTSVQAVANANCSQCNGTITLTPSGGTPNYTFAWLPGNMTTQTVTGLCAGVYTATVTDASGCTIQVQIPLSNNNGPVLTSSSTSPTCFNACTGTANVLVTSGNGPFTFSWSPGGQTTASVTGLCAGTYFCIVTDANGCITIETITITQPPQMLSNATVVNATCNGICDGSITLSTSGGTLPYTYLWSNAATTSAITGLCVGAYSVTVTDAVGCTAVFNFNIIGSIVVSATASSTNAGCNGNCSGTATVTNVTGGTSPYTYQWSDPNGQFTPTATGLCAGTYTVTVTDYNGCVGTQTVTITQPQAIVANPNITDATCGQCNGQIVLTPSGGTVPYTFIWSNNATTQNISNLCAGVYMVTITDAVGCTATFNIPVNNSGGPTGTVAVTNPSCFGACDGSATVTPSGGTPPYTFNWVPTGQTTATVTGLCVGTYIVQIQDSLGCIGNVTVTISTPTQIIPNPTIVHTDCGICNGSISLNPSGGTGPYTYLWQPGNLTTPAINNLCAGNYTVTITDANGCTSQTIIGVQNINGPTATVTSTNLSCNGACNGTATLTVVGGTSPYTFLWSNGATTQNLTGLCAGTYAVTVTDAAGCVDVLSVTITQPPPIVFSFSFSQDPLCNGNCNGVITAIPSGGTLPYTYAWNNGATTQTISGLCAGNYSVIVTDANGCTATHFDTLVDPPVLNITGGIITPASCNTIPDGAIDITVVGGTQPYSFSWTPSNQTTEDLSNAFIGNYTVTVTDANGCTDTAQFTITSTVTVIANALGADTTCPGTCTMLDGSTSINAVTFQWIDVQSNNVISTSDSVLVCPTTSGANFFALIATNGACSDTDTVVIFINTPPVADAGPNQTILSGTSTIIGGNPTGPIGSTYSWWPAQGVGADTSLSNPTVAPSVTTMYYVLVTDANGCTSLDSVLVTVIPDIIFPNGISPNGDGANDEWIIDGIEFFPDCVVEIYNRWGELLFRSVGYPPNGRWKGLYKGKELPVGTYYYIIDLKSEFFPNAFTGPITLMR